MSLYQVQQCVFDHLRAREAAPAGEEPPALSPDGYDLTATERLALTEVDVDALHRMGVHPVLVNGLCRANGWRRDDYRVLFAAAPAADAAGRRPRWRAS